MKVRTINITDVDDKQLLEISKKNLLALNLEEMKTIKNYFNKKGRNPTDIELETIAQTWSEHCKHKTLTAKIEYKSETSKDDILPLTKLYNNLLEETIFKITKELNKKFCVSVFKDNAGIIEFDKNYGIAFKVETHNHPSAIEPYGGAATGIGGVIRDILGVGKGAKPILNTDIFCFGPLDYSHKKLLKGVFHPKRIFKGVVSGVRDYGNRMGIPTANGAVLFDEGYVYNPLVYCGTVGIIPKNKSFKKVSSGDYIISVGGRTGRDGIHGATFSSLALDKNTPLSPVQIGNPIIEKKVMDTVLQARDMDLYTGITDCGAGGYSSAVGELGKNCGARVFLDRVPLKYKGLLPWEIWLSEAQERMVLSVKEKNLSKILKIFQNEDVEAFVLGRFTNTKKLEVFYKNKKICDIDMNFLHNGLPKRHYECVWKFDSKYENQKNISGILKNRNLTYKSILYDIFSDLNVCSKEWIIQQYDHEVQGQTVLKPLQNRDINDTGPGDACVLWINNIKNSFKGISIACGINPEYGKIDPYWMAASAIDETLRNLVCVGTDINKVALLDNFCWGRPENKHQLAGLVRACQACYDIAKVYRTPFISGKDSLNNDYMDEKLQYHSIPSTLLISGIGIIDDIKKCISMYFKEPENLIYLLGETKNELGGSLFYKILKFRTTDVPKVNPITARKLMITVNRAIKQNLILSCHDCSEGGISVALGEMCFSGGLGAEINLNGVKVDKEIEKLKKQDKNIANLIILFSESNSRFIVEVKKENKEKFEKLMKKNVFCLIGRIKKHKKFIVKGLNNRIIINEDIDKLKSLWKNSLKNKL